jgi:ribonucleoside-diphosphate reductase alpha chain
MTPENIKTNNDMPFTPAVPDDLPQVDLTENARQVLIRRYVRRGDDGKPAESIEGMFWRVAYHIAQVETNWGDETEIRAREFYEILSHKRFFPNSPTFTGAGTPLGQLAACFVLPISDDMGRESTGIFQTLHDAALIQQTGGGNGFSFSHLRPQGTLVKSSAGQATGPIGFLRVYDDAFGEIAQGGSRRGANMAVLRIDHPDIEDFISCKTNENAITNFNISVGITDAFMNAVVDDQMWDLRFPDVKHPGYRSFTGSLEEAEKTGIPIIVYRQVRARELFDKIVKQSHHNGEPGILFLDTANRFNPVPHLYQLEATNPCGEQWLGPYENCCLGSINLAEHLGEDKAVDWEKLRQTVVLSTIFLDDVVDANKYVPAVPQLEESARRARRIGLGIMGLADLMYHVGIRYGSTEGIEFASLVIEYVRYYSMQTSIELAKKRGAFPAIKGSIYDPENFLWYPPSPILPITKDWGRPEINWENLSRDICRYGIRNAAQTTIAPTGTIATVAGCEGYGCEPVFALAYIRHVNDNGKDLQLTYGSPLFEKALVEAGIPPEERDAIFALVREKGSVQEINIVPEDIRNVFVVSQDISADEHVGTQAAMQAFVDNSLSKTINFPVGATEEDVANAYINAWKLGCKGITVYVTGSREKVVLETHGTAEKKNDKTGIKDSLSDSDAMTLWHDSKKPRPRYLPGYTYSINTPLGKAFVTINENGDEQPFEIFINTAKAGSDTAAVSEAIGRLISYLLRITSPIEPLKRLEEIVRQLTGIGGGRPMGFGPNRVRSLPDGVAQVVEDYIRSRLDRDGNASDHETSNNGFNHGGSQNDQMSLLPPADTIPRSHKIGDLCPECGEAAVVNEEGCRKCYVCGYSEC